MGLAASQARLLSITSRMADNELRSQLINNAKMRLTTESSKVSDEYIAALNKTQLMFSNHTSEDSSQLIDLTFNNLTSFSAMNNQYGLVNKTGQILVSEIDTSNYQKAFATAKADTSIDPTDTEGLNAKALEEFLKLYDLEYDTTYFENEKVLEKYGDNIQDIYEGNVEYEYVEASNGNPPAANRISGIHYGYDKSKTSTEYGAYEALLEAYQKADAEYTAAVKQDMKDYINTDSKASFGGTQMSYEDVYKKLMAADETELQADYQKYQDFMKQYWNTYIVPMLNGKSATFKAGMEEYLSMTVGSTYTDEYTPAPARGTLTDYTNAGATVDTINHTITWPSTINPEDVLPEQAGDADLLGDGAEWTEYINLVLDAEDVQASIVPMYQYFQSNVMGALDRSKFVISQKAKDAQTEYYKQAERLSQFIFGMDVGEAEYDKLDDMDWICFGDYVEPSDPTQGRVGTSPHPTTALDTSEGGVAGVYVDIDGKVNGEPVTETYYANFQAVKDVYMCDKMMEEFGTPKYTWVNREDPNENSVAKAEWYTNLFEKMQESGYETLVVGLAHSTDWIQYALESSLVSLVQVNKDGDWVSTMYTNCSDITESTADVDITIAEAEYTKAMNKIQAKDKRYDLELKNIDTEHNSLQTEYDSIKSVMDKNVERNFKMFEA